VTIRNKLVVASCAPLILVVIGLTIYSVASQRSTKLAALAQKANLFGELVVSAVGPSLAVGDADDAKHALAVIPSDRELASIVVFDLAGKLIAAAGDSVDERGSRHALAGVSEANRVVQTDDSLTQVFPMGAGKDRVGTAVLQFNKVYLNSDVRRITLISGLGAALGALICLLMAIAVARAIAVPLEQMSRMAREIAQGSVDHGVEYRSADEIGVLADSFREMTTYIRNVARGIERLGAGDLTAEVKPRSEKDLIAKNFQIAVASLRATMQHMSDAAVALSGASDDLGHVSQQMGANAESASGQAQAVAGAADHMSRNMQAVAHSTEAMTASVRAVALNAARAAQVATAAVHVASSTTAIVTKLGDSSAEIGNVIKVINSIAEQTNLLALNANIEAARAGELGKGFAVVANEVKELAKATAKATEDIGRKIATIQTDARGAVDSITKISTTIAEVNEIQTSIARAVGEQVNATADIGRNVNEAARSTSAIASNITTVAQATQGTARGAAQTQSSASKLSRMAAELRAEVGRFDTGQGAADASPSRYEGRDLLPTPIDARREDYLEGSGFPLSSVGTNENAPSS
jgi:methyl-accepting chemotaxis protein